MSINCRRAPCVPDPGLASGESQDPSGPERKHEDVGRSDSGRRERHVEPHPDDPHRGDSDGDCESADHPLAVTGHVAAPDGDDGERDGDQEDSAEDDDRGRLRRTAEGHEEAEVEAGQHGHDGGSDENAAGPAMEPDVAVPDPRRELKRREQEDEPAREDVEHRHQRVVAETPVEAIDFRGPLRRQGILPVESFENLLPGRLGAPREVAGKNAAPDDRGDPDRDEERDPDPQAADDGRGREPESGLAAGTVQE